MKSRLLITVNLRFVENDCLVMRAGGTCMLIAMVRASCTPLQFKERVLSMNERMDMVYLDLRGKRFELERARLLDLPESVLL